MSPRHARHADPAEPPPALIPADGVLLRRTPRLQRQALEPTPVIGAVVLVLGAVAGAIGTNLTPVLVAAFAAVSVGLGGVVRMLWWLLWSGRSRLVVNESGLVLAGPIRQTTWLWSEIAAVRTDVGSGRSAWTEWADFPSITVELRGGRRRTVAFLVSSRDFLAGRRWLRAVCSRHGVPVS